MNSYPAPVYICNILQVFKTFEPLNCMVHHGSKLQYSKWIDMMAFAKISYTLLIYYFYFRIMHTCKSPTHPKEFFFPAEHWGIFGTSTVVHIEFPINGWTEGANHRRSPMIGWSWMIKFHAFPSWLVKKHANKFILLADWSTISHLSQQKIPTY